MQNKLSRREILKLSSLLPFLYFIPGETRRRSSDADRSNDQNILIIVFDAWSAHNISLYGYPRDTTPNLKRLAERAIVYHNHFSSAPWTLPGTASLLTGVYPWTHRATNSHAIYNNISGMIEKFQSSNIFCLFQEGRFSTIAYTHNPYTEILLSQFINNIDIHLNLEELFINDDPLLGLFFPNDKFATDLAQRQIFWDKDTTANSLLLSGFLQKWVNNKLQKIFERYKYNFPRKPPSLPDDNYYFLQEEATDWALKSLGSQAQPFLGYFHFYPPHDPYRTRREFIDIFRNGWTPPSKPEHIFSEKEPKHRVVKQRRYYDEFIAYVDAEFARLFKALEETGLLSNTWVVLTTDHGESFERGSMGHLHLLMHNPVIHIPLLIFPPGNNKRVDVYHRTNTIDLLPTLLHTMGMDIPPWCEGEVLPPFINNANSNGRTIFSMNPMDKLPHTKMTKGVYAIFKEEYKLLYYFGLKEMKGHDEYFELYNIEKDPEELDNLYERKKGVADELFNELKTEMKKADAPYI
jgi:arylsulfatase A-like enzyme